MVLPPVPAPIPRGTMKRDKRKTCWLKVSICSNPECRAVFPYLSHRVRDRCPQCSSELHAEQRRRSSRLARRLRVRAHVPAELQDGLAPRQRVAAALNLTTSEVRHLESEALLKLRAHPELRDIWREVRDAGVLSLLDPPDVWGALAEIQVGVADFWRAHDRLLQLGDHDAAAEIVAEISQFQGLMNALTKGMGA